MNIETLLGDAYYRYFGHGHKKSIYQIKNISNLEKFETIYVLNANISHSGNWSEKAKEILVPHLSTIDAIILSMLLIENYLNRKYKYISCESLLLTEFEIKASKVPVHDLNNLKLAIMREEIDVIKKQFTFVTDIQGMKVTLSLKAVNSVLNIKEDGDEDKINFISNHLKSYYHNISNIRFSSNSKVSAMINANSLNSQNFCGIQSNHVSNLSLIECLLIFSQMCQVLAYNHDSMDREDTNNLWMRSIKAEIIDVALCVNRENSLMVHGIIDKAKRIKKSEEEWRTFHMSGITDCQNIRFSGRVAHKISNG